MTLNADDRLSIRELIALHGHLVDAGQFDRLGELFTDDFVYDVSAPGSAPLEAPARSPRPPARWATTTRSATT